MGMFSKSYMEGLSKLKFKNNFNLLSPFSLIQAVFNCHSELMMTIWGGKAILHTEFIYISSQKAKKLNIIWPYLGRI